MKLWCVLCIPKLRPNDEKLRLQGIQRLLNGPGKSELSQMMWAVQAAVGFNDNREPKYQELRQRLIVFEDLRDAVEAAKKATNEFWIGKVREVRVKAKRDS